jgi:hypothetical protein
MSGALPRDRRASRKPSWNSLRLVVGIGVLLALATMQIDTPLGASATPVSAQSLPNFKMPYGKGEDVRWTGGPHGYNEGRNLDGIFKSGEGSGLDFQGISNRNFTVLAMAAR